MDDIVILAVLKIRLCKIKINLQYLVITGKRTSWSRTLRKEET